MPVDASGLSSEESIDAFLAMGKKLYPEDGAIQKAIRDLANDIQASLDIGNGRDADAKLVMGPEIKDQMDFCKKILNIMQHCGIQIDNWRPVFGGARMHLTLGVSAPLDKIAKDLEEIAQSVGGDIPGVENLIGQLKNKRVNPKHRVVVVDMPVDVFEPKKEQVDKFAAEAGKRGYVVRVNTIDTWRGKLVSLIVDFSEQASDTMTKKAEPNPDTTAKNAEPNPNASLTMAEKADKLDEVADSLDENSRHAAKSALHSIAKSIRRMIVTNVKTANAAWLSIGFKKDCQVVKQVLESLDIPVNLEHASWVVYFHVSLTGEPGTVSDVDNGADETLARLSLELKALGTERSWNTASAIDDARTEGKATITVGEVYKTGNKQELADIAAILTRYGFRMRVSNTEDTIKLYAKIPDNLLLGGDEGWTDSPNLD